MRKIYSLLAMLLVSAFAMAQTNLLTNGDFSVVGELASDATDRYAVGTPWESNVAFANMGIRVMASSAATHGSNVLVWRGSGNGNYISQPCAVEADKAYQVSIYQIASGNANADFNVGFGTAAGKYDIASGIVRLGTNNDGIKTAKILMPKTISGTIYFTFANTTTNTASAGNDPVSQIDYITVEELDDAEKLPLVKENALKSLPSLDGGIFSPAEADVNLVKTAINAATTVEEVETIVAGATYTISALTGEYYVKNANGGYLAEAKISADPVKVTFEQATGGFYIKVNGDKYINMKGGDTWSMNATAEANAVWNFTLADGKYTIKGPNGLIGSDNTADGSSTYGNKKITETGKNIFWKIEEVPADPLEAAKLVAISNLPEADASIFTPSVAEVEAAKAAINAATTEAEVEAAVAAATFTIPALTGLYTIYNTTAENYLGEVKLSADLTYARFEQAAGGFYINVNGKYINMKGGNTYSMSATAEASTAWNFPLTDGKYTIKGPNGLIGADNAAAGSSTYGNKTADKNGYWTIAPAASYERATATGAYGTICLPYAFTATGATIYSASVSGDEVVLAEVTTPVAGTPYIYQATANAQTFEYTSGALAAAVAAEPLTGVFYATEVPVSSYVLQTNGADQKFYIVADGKQPTLSANKAYLTVASSARELNIAEEATAIKAVNALVNGDAKIYDINGRELNSLQKGINIVNGVKVLVK